MASTEGSDKQLQVRFVTKLEKYGVEDMPLSIPVTAEPDTLNQLLAELLSVSLGSISALPEFDFLVSGEFLRTSLGTLIEEKGLNTEDVVEIEYVEKLPAPEPFQSLTHDDWVASVHTNGQWILSGCYDNVVHIWNERAKHLLAIPGHGGPVKAVRWLPSSGDPKEGLLFVSASHDQTVRLWRWFPDKNVATPIFIGCGHARSVEALATEPSGRMIASGSFDSMLKIWSADPDEGGEAGDAKKSKGDASSVEKRVPLMTLSGHAEAISAISWMTPDEICTVSWDQTIRLWDAEMGSNKTQLAGTRAFLACDWSKLRSGPALLTASADRHIRLYDPRSPEGNLVKLTFTAHSGWITCVRWSESREDLFISGGHDQMLRLWDIRSPKVALYELQGHEDKIMCCDWSVPTRVASGGADNSVKIYSVKPDAGKPV